MSESEDISSEGESDSDEEDGPPVPDLQWDDFQTGIRRTWDLGPTNMFINAQSLQKEYDSASILNYINPTDPLYDKSPHSAKDFCRYLMAMKQSLGLGDYAYAVIAGSIVSVLPVNNLIAMCLDQSPSTYTLIKVINVLACFNYSHRTLRYDACRDGCEVFREGREFCEVCAQSRWKHCTKEKCYGIDQYGDLTRKCHHPMLPVSTLYYMPVRDRIGALLTSDLKNFFKYNDLCHKTPMVSFIRDVL